MPIDVVEHKRDVTNSILQGDCYFLFMYFIQMNASDANHCKGQCSGPKAIFGQTLNRYETR